MSHRVKANRSARVGDKTLFEGEPAVILEYINDHKGASFVFLDIGNDRSIKCRTNDPDWDSAPVRKTPIGISDSDSWWEALQTNIEDLNAALNKSVMTHLASVLDLTVTRLVLVELGSFLSGTLFCRDGEHQFVILSNDEGSVVFQAVPSRANSFLTQHTALVTDDVSVIDSDFWLKLMGVDRHLIPDVALRPLN